MTPPIRTIALTGASGYVGGTLLRGPLENYRVRALRRPDSKIVEAIGEVTWIVGDIADAATWHTLLEGADALIHLAAAGVANQNESFSTILQGNVHSVPHIFDAAAKHGVRSLVLTGSSFEYGIAGEQIATRPLNENDPLKPSSTYGASKVAALALANMFAMQTGIRTIVPRLFQVFGGTEAPSRLFPSVIRNALTGMPIKTTDGRQVRDFVHIDDVISALLCAMTADISLLGPGAHVFNIASGIPTPVRKAILLIAQLCNTPADQWHIGALSQRRNEIMSLVGDPSAAALHIGWIPRITLEEGLRRMITDYRDRKP